MSPLTDHEKALLLVLREDDHPVDAFDALLAHPEMAAHHMPAPWVFERAGVDLLDALPELDAIRREDLRHVLDVLVRLHTPERLDALCGRTWRETDEQVRAYLLKRPVLSTLGAILRFAPRSVDLPPPPEFVQGQIYIHRFEMEYRLRRGEEPPHPVAPPEEGSLVFYPFDPANAAGRREAGLAEGRGPVFEVFAYGTGRARHRRVLEDVAHRRGWWVVDTAESGPRAHPPEAADRGL